MRHPTNRWATSGLAVLSLTCLGTGLGAARLWTALTVLLAAIFIVPTVGGILLVTGTAYQERRYRKRLGGKPVVLLSTEGVLSRLERRLDATRPADED